MINADKINLDLSAQSYTFDGKQTLNAGHDLSIKTTEDITNLVDIMVAGNLSLTAKNVINQTGNKTLKGNNHLNITATDNVLNSGAMIGGNVIISGQNVYNVGTKAVMASRDNLAIYAQNSVENIDGANIFAGNNLEIARDKTRDASGVLVNRVQSHVLNEGSTIEALNDLEVSAVDILNRRKTVTAKWLAPVETSLVKNHWHAERSTKKYRSYTAFLQKIDTNII